MPQTPTSDLPNSAATAFDASGLHGVTRLPQWGVIRAKGEEAAKFLHGQLTQDFALLGMSEARLAAFCSAKGRMQASFIGFRRDPEDILLLCHQDVLAATLKRLSMFVMRSKLKMSDASAAFAVWGLAGQSAPGAEQLPTPPWSKAETPQGASLVRLYPSEGVARALWIAPVAEDGTSPKPQGPDLPAPLWDWLDVRSGIAAISQPVVEAYVPQMLNYESVGGVNFKKGCYPGQEVVARSQFRGTLKRRAFLLHSSQPLSVGQEIFHDSDAEQPCGTVASAAPHPVSGWDAVASLQVSATTQGVLLAAGEALTLLPLPYPLLDDI
ncbi:folate-binding protein YgfZ [Hydrogenophaga sp.]|uniref:CAF17-like 4Fe-4S cluster assembly/insertion protein YgfZ n=1 Tax=Hydrogenophaga sp. TaxID=1904254 RepID=UPI0035681D1D